MKIATKKPRTKILALSLGLLLVATGAYTYAAFQYSWWPFLPKVNSNSRTTDLKEAGRSNETNTDNDSSGSVDASPSDTEDQSQGGSYQTVSPPNIEPPKQDAAFPIENSHYRIEQTGSSSFNVTLFAIINSPSQYNDYRAQLKQYKAEALDYLNKRFNGQTLTINWNPSDA